MPPLPPHTALLTALQTPTPLRKVPRSSQKDSSAAKAGHVIYEPTAHSQVVEAQERAPEPGDEDEGEEEEGDEDWAADSEDRWSPRLVIERHLEMKRGGETEVG